jgi:hypothetical protein
LIESTSENLVLFGGDESYLGYYDIISPSKLYRVQSYGEIVKLAVSSDKKTVVVVTENGVVLSFGIFPVNKYSKDD